MEEWKRIGATEQVLTRISKGLCIAGEGSDQGLPGLQVGQGADMLAAAGDGCLLQIGAINFLREGTSWQTRVAAQANKGTYTGSRLGWL